MSDDPLEDGSLRVLMAEYQDGRIEAFDRLYAALGSSVRHYLGSLTRDAHRAQDLLQETFLQVHRSRHTYDRRMPVRPWIFAIARHVFLMERRAAGRSRVAIRPDDQLPDVPVPPEVAGLADRDRLQRALKQVGAERREALILHHVWGWTFREIGQFLGIREAAAKLRSSRGMSDLRSLISPGGNQGHKK